MIARELLAVAADAPLRLESNTVRSPERCFCCFFISAIKLSFGDSTNSSMGEPAAAFSLRDVMGRDAAPLPPLFFEPAAVPVPVPAAAVARDTASNTAGRVALAVAKRAEEELLLWLLETAPAEAGAEKAEEEEEETGAGVAGLAGTESAAIE
jgi:hypothetical protein